jgi:hypothetical protein
MRRKHITGISPTGDALARYENNTHSGAAWFDIMPTPANGTDSTAITATIVDVSQADPGVIETAAPHGFGNGQLIEITGVVGMVELNNLRWTAQNVTATEFDLYTVSAAAVDTTAFTAYGSGGVAAVGPLVFPIFNGTTFIELGQPAKLNLGEEFTVVSWGSQNADSTQGYERLVSRDNGALRSFIFSQNDTNGFPYAAIFISGASHSITGPGTYANGDWHHYVITHDGSDLVLYIDGALEGRLLASQALWML